MAMRWPERACWAPATASGALTVRQCFFGLVGSVPGMGVLFAIAWTISAALALLFVVEVADFELGLSPLSETPPDEFNVSLRELHSRCGTGVMELRRLGRESDTEERE